MNTKHRKKDTTPYLCPEKKTYRKRAFVYILTGAVCLLAICLGIRYEQAWHMQREIAGKVLRFHVIANSDSPRDQELKLMVRDAVGGELSAVFAAASSKDQSRAIAASRLSQIEETAEAVLRQEGCEYEVRAILDEVDFPEKSYGGFTFPAGRYDALELVIGEGNGHNWWCVMYPNLCFSGSVYEVTNEEAGEVLREVLTEEEYREVFSSGSCEIRFRYLTFLNDLLKE